MTAHGHTHINASATDEEAQVRAGAGYLLFNAARLIREYGWTQRTFADAPTGPYCLEGALRVAAFGATNNSAPAHEVTCRSHLLAHRLLQTHLRCLTGNGYLLVSEWNDTLCSGGVHAAEVLNVTYALNFSDADLIEDAA